MATFKNIKELEQFINKQAQKALKNEVAEEVKRTLKENIIDEVYDKYTPTEYERTGGLYQDRNIEAIVNGNTLSVRSTRTERGRDIAQIIESGIGYEWKDSRIYNMQPYPRPFHYETFLELQRTLKHVDALKKGLNKLGVKTL